MRLACTAGVCVCDGGGVDVWLNYMQLETSHPRGKRASVGHLHWRAVKDLDPQLVDEFNQRSAALYNTASVRTS